MSIAVIGMGTMGAPMARNLLKAGHSVVVHNRTREREEPLAAEGASRAGSPAEAARAADIVLTCVSDTPDVERVLLDPEIGAIHGLRAGALAIACSSIAKVANQVVIAGTFLALGEALTLAHRAGADPEKVVEAIGGGVAGSWILQNRSGNMLNGTYPLGFRTRLHRKDLGIALETARAFEVPVHIASLVATLEDGLIAQGYGDEDMSNLARCVRQGAGVPEGPMKG